MEKEFRFEDNSFDVIRIVSALFIVLGNIETHLKAPVFAPVLYVQQRWVGLVCLFVISGYVIPASLERSKNNQEYLKKRVMRVYPALWGATLFSLIAIVVFGMAYSHLKVQGIDIMTWLLGQLTFFQFYVLTIVGINENAQSIVLTYVFTMLLSCLSVFEIEKQGKKLFEKVLRLK